jgi:hypothetical protein
MMCGSEKNLRKVGKEKGKKVQYMINKLINPKQNMRRGNILAKLYSMVKIPHTETPAPSCGVTDGQTERGRRLEDQNKEQYFCSTTRVRISSLRVCLCKVALTTTLPLHPNYVCHPYWLAPHY